MTFHKGLNVQLTPAIDDLIYIFFVQQSNSFFFLIVLSNRADH